MRHNQNSGKRNFKRIKWTVTFIIVFLFFILGYFALQKASLLKIKNVDAKLQNVECIGENQVKELVLSYNFNFFSSNRTIENKIKNKYLCVGKIVINKELPDKLNIELFGREVIAKVKTVKVNTDNLMTLDLENTEASASSDSAKFSTGEYLKKIEIAAHSSTDSAEFLLDKSGFIFKNNFKDSDLAKIIFFGDLKVGEKIESEKTEKIVQIIKKLKEFEIPRDDLILIDNRFIVNSQIKVLFSLKKRIDYQLASLQLILQKAKIESKLIESVDLRFDKPVVIYAPKKL